MEEVKYAPSPPFHGTRCMTISRMFIGELHRRSVSVRWTLLRTLIFTEKKQVSKPGRSCRCLWLPNMRSLFRSYSSWTAHKTHYITQKWLAEPGCKQAAQLSQRGRAAGCVMVFAKSTLCLKKNIPDVFSYNSRSHWRIFIIFGKNVTEKASNHMLLYFSTSPN